MSAPHSQTSGDAKTSYLVRGSVFLLLGAWMAVENIRFVLYGLRTGTLVRWYISDTALRFIAAVFFMWLGSRAIRRAGQEVPPTKIGWARLLVGISFIYADLRGQFFPSPGSLQPENADKAITVLVYLAGVALVIAAFLRLRTKRVAALRSPGGSTVEPQIDADERRSDAV
jgi:hypothetical protein